MTKVGDQRRTCLLTPRLSPLRILLGCGLFMAGWIVLGTSNAQAATDLGVSSSERTTITGSPAVEYQNSSHIPPSGASPATKGTAGGADASVDAGVIGGDEARVEGVEPMTSWPGRVSGARTEGTSAHIGHVRASEGECSSRNMSNVHTPEYECMAMKEDTLASLPGFVGNVGRVVQDATTAVGDSVPSVWQALAARQVGEPALGVMGGLIQSVSSPAERVPGFEPIWFELESLRTVSELHQPAVSRSEAAAPYSLPPVSSFSPPPRTGTESRSTGSSESPAKTTPAPNSIPEQTREPIGVHAAGERIAPDRGLDVIPGDVSPWTDAATAATDVEPTSRKSMTNERAPRPGASPG